MVWIATVNDAEQLNILNAEINGEDETSIDTDNEKEVTNPDFEGLEHTEKRILLILDAF